MDQQYGEHYNKYIEDADKQRQVSKDALAGKYSEYLGTLDRNQKAEFWQNIIHSLGKVVAGGMNMAMNTAEKDADGIPHYSGPVDVAGAYKPIDVFNRETADKSAESRFKAEESLGNTDLQNAMSKLEAVRKGQEAKDMITAKTQSDKYAKIANFTPNTSSSELGANQTVTQPSYSNPALKPPVERTSDTEAQKTAALAATSLGTMDLLRKINDGSVRNKVDFMKKVTSPTHAKNLDRMYDVIEARKEGKTPAQISRDAVVDYGRVVSTNNKAAADEFGLDISFSTQPRTDAPMGAPVAPVKAPVAPVKAPVAPVKASAPSIYPSVTNPAIRKRAEENKKAGK